MNEVLLEQFVMDIVENPSDENYGVYGDFLADHADDRGHLIHQALQHKEHPSDETKNNIEQLQQTIQQKYACIYGVSNMRYNAQGVATHITLRALDFVGHGNDIQREMPLLQSVTLLRIRKELVQHVSDVLHGLANVTSHAAGDFLPKLSEDMKTKQKTKHPITFESLDIGTMSTEDLIDAVRQFDVSKAASGILHDKQFLENLERGSSEAIPLVHIAIRDLQTAFQIITSDLIGIYSDEGQLEKNGRIHQYGLTVCPVETALYKRITDTQQQKNDKYYVTSMPIADSRPGVDRSVFSCGCNASGLHLNAAYAKPDSPWYRNLKIVCQNTQS